MSLTDYTALTIASMSKFQSFLSKPGLITALLFLVVTGLFAWSVAELIEVSALTAALVKLGILSGYYFFVDRILMRAFNTEDAIRTGNRSFAIVIGALVLGAAVILSAA